MRLPAQTDLEASLGARQDRIAREFCTGSRGSQPADLTLSAQRSYRYPWQGLLDLGTKLEPWGQLVLLEKKGPRGRLDLREKGEPWGRPVPCLSGLLVLQEKREPLDRLVPCLSGLLDLQEKRELWGRLVLYPLDIRENREPWGQLDLQEKREPWDRLVLCPLDKPDLEGRLVCRETRFALDQLNESPVPEVIRCGVKPATKRSTNINSSGPSALRPRSVAKMTVPSPCPEMRKPTTS
uniref:Uncharacterized protein n=1 Tax=Branchiostoma floridae TaxID=7739 RepID=C3XUW0_BRAFL|eukprot:XP_002612176.1 hypothetical protein BRAFLDRAFT_88918 [Branchiostoma floridae]